MEQANITFPWQVPVRMLSSHRLFLQRRLFPMSH